MNNYVNIDRVSALLMTAVYLIILASIATIINVIVIQEIDAKDKLKFLITLLKASLILLKLK